jgi:hypothetical protein
VSEPDLIADEVLSYWMERTRSSPRAKAKDAALKRITARLGEGYGPADLKRCVDFAMYDEWYVAHGYYKQPDVIWRNGERVASILARCAFAASKPLPL